MAKIGNFIAEFFNLEFFVNLCFGVQLNVLLIAFLGLKYVVVSTTEGILNLSLSILVVLFYLLLTIVVFTKIKTIHRNKVQHIGDGSKLEKDK
jgi:hypothetical protein